jgi:hypothetical protein
MEQERRGNRDPLLLTPGQLMGKAPSNRPI